MFRTLHVEIRERIMLVTLDRQKRLNAFNQEMFNDLLKVLDEADDNDEVRAVIITGAGKGFCSGADLERGTETFSDDTPLVEFRDAGGILSLRIYELKKPIIAAINGTAVGVGATMTLPMDIRLISSEAEIGFNFARRGITMEACSGWFLPRLVGMGKAAEWIYTGKMVAPQEALANGLVNYVTNPEELLAKAFQLAHEIADHTSAVSVALSRHLMWTMIGADHPIESHKIESKMIHWTGKQTDVKEGILSYLEKRQPKFQMKVTSDMPPFYPWDKSKEYQK
ncbi:enoyl-CoA hydratase-related protein [Bacillus massiliglaciei]|uniref:enoyl-CoA hydratase-related protein n=1 Tax=Bacillus massiliglaciei TaxID=1816693 RepID=UPI000B19C759|nr:enoyl-CoA hydratase-related protein [Bacillus massiliglaciei]